MFTCYYEKIQKLNEPWFGILVLKESHLKLLMCKNMFFTDIILLEHECVWYLNYINYI